MSRPSDILRVRERLLTADPLRRVKREQIAEQVERLWICLGEELAKRDARLDGERADVAARRRHHDRYQPMRPD